ncbi:hypothetical protein Tco_0982071 [Tanacetum coccineum]
MLPSNIIYLYVYLAVGFTCADTMADMNIPANDVPAEQAPAFTITQMGACRQENIPSDTYGFTMKMEILLEPNINTKLMVSIKVKGTSRMTNNQAFTIKKGMSMPVQMSQAQDGERPQVDDQRLDLANDLKEAQDHISHSIISHKTKITTSKYKILREESKTTS